MKLTKHESTISSDLFVQILVHTLLHISTIYQASTKPKPTPRIYRILKLYKTHMYHDMWYDTMTNVAQVSFHPALNVLITFYPYRYLIPKSPTNSTHLPLWIGCLGTQKKHRPQTSSCPLGFPHVRPIGFQRGIEFGVGGNHLGEFGGWNSNGGWSNNGRHFVFFLREMKKTCRSEHESQNIGYIWLVCECI